MPSWWIYNSAEGVKGPWTDDDIVQFVKRGYLKPNDKLKMEGQDVWSSAADVVEHLNRPISNSANEVRVVKHDSQSSHPDVAIAYAIPKDVRDALHDCLVNIFPHKADFLAFLTTNGMDVLPLTVNISAQRIRDVVSHAIDMMERLPDGDSLVNTLILNLIRVKDISELNASAPANPVAAIAALDALRCAHRNTRDIQLKSRISAIHLERRQTATEAKRADLLRQLTNLAMAVPKLMTPQQRGYRFEGLLQALFELEEIATTGPTRTTTQQHDNRLYFDGEHYLVEAKWHQEPISTRDINHFHAKVDGVFYGRGLFFSMSGFVSGLVADVTHGKDIKLILFDQLDVTMTLEGQITFRTMLAKKIRAAQTLGYTYFDAMRDKPKPD